MVHNWKSWLASASVLLLVGAGCAGSVDQKASLEAETGMEAGEKTGEGASLDASVDAAVDAALAEIDASTRMELEENQDADVVANDDAELKAYGNTYVESEL
ncbi:MAG: hypothetical protein QY323_04900 [Patescibacteria group bacterium]|nr:MAG: hypothetical protein QY323_04900 [Patescibacteria group bacterium]